VIRALTMRRAIWSQEGCSGVAVEGDAPDVGTDANIDVPDDVRRDCSKAIVGTIRWTRGRRMRLWWRPPRLHLSASMRMFG
jgi:hypothetical protein